jgi:hypothetical protein
MSDHIQVILYSYRDKNLKDVVDNLYSRASGDNFSVFVIDQNNINRSEMFDNYDQMYYEFKTWDSIKSPCEIKMKKIDQASGFILIMSDDVMLSDSWDSRLMEFVGERDVVVSGHTRPNLFHKDLYFLEKNPVWDNKFALSQYVDRNFIFAKSELLQRAQYPGEVKYYGEEELLSLNFFMNGIDVFAAPGDLYQDLEKRLIENIYCPFSLEHNYDRVVDYFSLDAAKQFLEYHKIDKNKMFKLPHQYNDVSYIHTDMKFYEADGKKFIEATRVIN